MTRRIPAARPHGELENVLPDVFLVTGTIGMGPMRFSRNMVVIRQGDELVLVNTVRLNDAGLAALDALGKVTHVIRLAGFHGSDDPFYKDRYGCTVSAVRGQTYFTGINPKKGTVYFTPDEFLDSDSPLPVDGASLYVFNTEPAEGILRIPAGGGTLIAGDSLQNFGKADRFFNFPGKLIMRFMGFLKPHQLGPAWVKQIKPEPAEVSGVLELDFANVLPSHGAPVLGDARDKYGPTVRAYTRGK